MPDQATRKDRVSAAKWSRERRSAHCEALFAKWDAARAKSGRMDAAQAEAKARALVNPKVWPIVRAEDGRRWAQIAKFLPRRVQDFRVSIGVGHRYTIPGLGSGEGIQRTFTAGTYEACIINLRAWLKGCPADWSRTDA